MASARTYKQDMPPEGGYRPLCFERTFPKRFFTVPRLLFLHAISTTIFYITYKYDLRVHSKRQIERRSAIIAVTPMLEAEADREYFRQLRQNRDSEAELMKDVPHWEVGTLYGEPIYKTIPEDEYIRPQIQEYYAFTRQKYFWEEFLFRHWR